MDLAPMPSVASWRHHGVRAGFEVMYYEERDGGHLLRGTTTAVEDEIAWSVGYRIELDREWRTLRVRATSSTARGERQIDLRRTPDDHWFEDGRLRPELTGCVDVDFESSAVTNTLPVHRVAFALGGPHRSVPAAFVRAENLGVERMEQQYALLDQLDTDGAAHSRLRFDYASSTFDFACTLTYDAAGLVVDYPGIAERES